MKVRIAAGVAAAAALAAPATASSAVITAQGACFVSSRPVPLNGRAFTPGAIVSMRGGATGTAQADPAGSFTTQVQAPIVTSIAPRVVSVTATDGANPGNTATARFPVIRGLVVTNAPVSGRPRQKTTWRFAGFPPGKTIFGHYRVRGRTVKNYRFGRAKGPCGTLTVRARRVPVAASRIRTGTWRLQLDNRSSYRRTTTPRRVVRFSIFRAVQ